MNVITRYLKRFTGLCIGQYVKGSSIVLSKCNYTNNVAGSSSLLSKFGYINNVPGNILTTATKFLPNSIQGLHQIRSISALLKLHHRKNFTRKKQRKNPLGNAPFAKAVVLKTVIRKPKKPNSANRKCVVVKLSNGKEMTAYVPGIGHNLQEHSVVLCRVGRCKDVPGLKIKCVRGAYDLPQVASKRKKF